LNDRPLLPTTGAEQPSVAVINQRCSRFARARSLRNFVSGVLNTKWSTTPESIGDDEAINGVVGTLASTVIATVNAANWRIGTSQWRG
jgi:hypothetical protein